jgi:glycosyltransferase involved in cell wall biosynthesis
MKHTILSVAYPLTPVGPDAVGGSEQILTLLDEAITAAGHRSLVLAAEGSQVSGTLIPAMKARGKLTDKLREKARAVHAELLRATLERYPVDLIHMHSLDFHAYLPRTEIPILATLHLPPDWYPPHIFAMESDSFFLNCVSSSQERECPPAPRLLPSISNGVAVDRFATGGGQKGNFALAMGRICPEKAFHLALDAARKARCRLQLAGQVIPNPSHIEYFEREIQPRLDRKRTFVGPLGLSAKRSLLAEARCLLVPSAVAETSSLVAMEALAAGTPVIAFRSGALPEIVEHGRTGFVVSDVREMADAIRAADELDPENCRKAARTRFAASIMTARYLDTYEQILFEAAERKAQAARHGSWLVNWSTGIPRSGERPLLSGHSPTRPLQFVPARLHTAAGAGQRSGKNFR